MAVLVDGEGVVRDIAFRDEELKREIKNATGWLGKRWRGAVTVESRSKLDALLSDAASDRPLRWRHLNHPSDAGSDDVAISYSAVQVDTGGAVIAVGRDLRPLSALQRRLVDAQQALERDYASLRQAEARYRILFETATDALLILDAQTHRITEANPAARAAFSQDARPDPRRAGSRSLSERFDTASRPIVRQALAAVQATGRSEEIEVSDETGPVRLSIASLREEGGTVLLVRMVRGGAVGAPSRPAADETTLPALLATMPDGVAITDDSGDIVVVNAAFRAMTQVAPSESMRGEPLSRWLGQQGVDLGVLIANLRTRGSVRLFATTLRQEGGSAADVEVSASLGESAPTRFAFFIRNVGRRLGVDPRSGRDLPRSVGQMSELIGRVSLKELVRESADAIERLCIEAALDMTGNNRASAAEMLGLSRQSLYVKLRRYGLGGSEEEALA